MKIKTTKIEAVPQWATNYLDSGDMSDLNSEDLEALRGFEERLKKEGLALICPVEGSYNEFCAFPAFGLPCDTVDWMAEVLPKEKEWDLVFNETLVCHISVKARSRDDAIAEANRILSEGLDGLDSMGQKLKSCKLAKE